MLTEHSLATEGVILNYAEGPATGPPLVLLPGFTSTWESFQPIIPSLQAHWHLYTLDYRGHGKSGRAPGHYHAKDYLADVTALLDQRVGGPVVLFGHSMGGGLAVSYAAAHPSRAQAVIIGDVPVDVASNIALITSEAGPAAWRSLRALAGRPIDDILHALAQDDPPLVGAEAAALARALRALDPAVLDYHAEGRGQAFFEGVAEVDLRHLTCPVLIVQGDPACGGLLGDVAAAEMLAQLPHASLVQLPGISHDALLSVRAEPLLRQAVLPFLETIERYW